MAITSPPSDPTSQPGALAGTSRSRRPKQSFETWSWFFMRVSGLVLVFLALALLHGLNGLRWSIDDYIRSRPARATVKAVIYSVSGVLFAYGTFTIVAFQ